MKTAFVVYRMTEEKKIENGKEVQNQYRRYAWYNFTSDFTIIYDRIEIPKRMFFEVLWRDCKECYDIDLGLDESKKRLIYEKYGDNLIPSFLKARWDFLMQSDWYTGSNVPCISSSHGPDKISFHVTFLSTSMTPYGFEKIEDMVPFITDFKAYLEERGMDFGIDYKIYAKNKNMRLIGSRKPFTSRYLVDESGHKNYRDHIITLDGYYHKIIKVVDNLDDDLEIFSNSEIKADCEFGISSIDKILDKFCDLDFEWKQRDTKKGNMWLLIRKQPSNCPICEREHGKENQYVFINDGLALLGCYRWENVKKKYYAIGRIGPPTRKGFLPTRRLTLACWNSWLRIGGRSIILVLLPSQCSNSFLTSVVTMKFNL
jgi:hypothetical protein